MNATDAELIANWRALALSEENNSKAWAAKKQMDMASICGAMSLVLLHCSKELETRIITRNQEPIPEDRKIICFKCGGALFNEGKCQSIICNTTEA